MSVVFYKFRVMSCAVLLVSSTACLHVYASDEKKEIADAQSELKPYGEVKLGIGAPVSTLVSKPAIVTFNFQAPVNDFSAEDVQVINGKLIHFSGGSQGTMYMALVVADKDMDRQTASTVDIVVANSYSGLLSESIRIVFDEPLPEMQDITNMTTPSPNLHFSLVASRGGDAVDLSSKYQIANTLGAQIGFSLPLRSIQPQGYQMISAGSVRMSVGYEQLREGSKSGGDSTSFSAITGDLLYDMNFFGSVSILAGLTAKFNGTLESQNLKLKSFDVAGDGKVKFGNAYGFKFAIEYYPNDPGLIDLFFGFGVSVIDYNPASIIFEVSNDEDLSRHLKVGANSASLMVGVRI